jgi:hypothetical protein
MIYINKYIKNFYWYYLKKKLKNHEIYINQVIYKLRYLILQHS